MDRTGHLDAPSSLGCSNPGHFEESPGGAALNVARIAAAFGATPTLVSVVGQDAAGDALREETNSRGIEAQFEQSPKTSTGTYTSLIEPDGSLLVAMADMAVYDDFNADKLLPKMSELSAEDWLCVDTNLPPEQTLKMLRASESNRVGLTVSKAKAPRLLKFAEYLDLLFTNRIEAGALCGFDAEKTQSADGESFARAFAKIGIGSAVISDGAQDVILIENGEPSRIEVATVHQIVDVTGAGDALVGTSICALMRGMPLANSVGFGIKAAQAIIQSRGALRSDLVELVGELKAAK